MQHGKEVRACLCGRTNQRSGRHQLSASAQGRAWLCAERGQFTTYPKVFSALMQHRRMRRSCVEPATVW
jgi:hypothetical protein